MAKGEGALTDAANSRPRPAALMDQFPRQKPDPGVFDVKSMIPCCLLVAGATFCSAIVAAADKTLPAPVGARIGVMVMLDEQARQLHVGTTRFQNFEREAVADWGVPMALVDTLKQKLSLPDRPEIAVLESNAELRALSDEVLDGGWTEVRVGAKVKPILDALMQTAGLDYLVTVQPYEADINFQVSVPASGYGIYTYCHMLTGCDIRPLTHVQVAAFAANPVRLVGASAAGSAKETVPIKFTAKSARDLTAEQIAPVREPALNRLAAAIDRVLSESGLGAAVVQRGN